MRFREVSELSDSDSDVTVQDDDDVIDASDDEEAELTSDNDVRSSKGQGQGRSKVKRKPGPWFVRPPNNVSVGVSRTLTSDCVVDGDKPIGQWANYTGFMPAGLLVKLGFHYPS